LDGEVVLADEVLTPDSSSYWPADAWQPGGPAELRQAVRARPRHLDGLGQAPPAPELPAEVVEATRARYVQAYERLTGEPFAAWLARD
jgi:phosphoribosylaminoimidazole-succinocarboxamide synthase